MSTPIGHGIVGLAVARRLGIESRAGMAAALAVALLPDTDIAAGFVLHGDAWKVHRGVTHTVPFAIFSGALAAAALERTGRSQRSLLSLAAALALVALTHPLLDGMPFVRMSRQSWVPDPAKVQLAGMSLANWIVDIVQSLAIAWIVLRTHIPRTSFLERRRF